MDHGGAGLTLKAHTDAEDRVSSLLSELLKYVVNLRGLHLSASLSKLIEQCESECTLELVRRKHVGVSTCIGCRQTSAELA